MERLRRLKRQWVLGFGVLLMLALSAFAFGVAAAVIVPVVAGALLAVGVPLPQLGFLDALELSAFVWLPISVGVVMPEIADFAAERMREMDEAKRAASVAEIRRQKV